MTPWTFSGLLLALTTTACSSSYVPARSPRVATVWSAGYPSYFRDGVEYPSGMLLDGVEDAVQGNPRAEEEARTAHHLMIGGFVCELAGLGALGSGIALTASNPPGSTANQAGIGLLIGSIAASVTAIVLFMNAPPHAYDAVNIYNDGIDARLRPAPPFATVPMPVPMPPPLTR
jgi:hypothetical protein